MLSVPPLAAVPLELDEPVVVPVLSGAGSQSETRSADGGHRCEPTCPGDHHILLGWVDGSGLKRHGRAGRAGQVDCERRHSGGARAAASGRSVTGLQMPRHGRGGFMTIA